MAGNDGRVPTGVGGSAVVPKHLLKWGRRRLPKTAGGRRLPRCAGNPIWARPVARPLHSRSRRPLRVGHAQHATHPGDRHRPGHTRHSPTRAGRTGRSGHQATRHARTPAARRPGARPLRGRGPPMAARRGARPLRGRTDLAESPMRAPHPGGRLAGPGLPFLSGRRRLGTDGSPQANGRRWWSRGALASRARGGRPTRVRALPRTGRFAVTAGPAPHLGCASRYAAGRLGTPCPPRSGRAIPTPRRPRPWCRPRSERAAGRGAIGPRWPRGGEATGCVGDGRPTRSGRSEPPGRGADERARHTPGPGDRPRGRTWQSDTTEAGLPDARRDRAPRPAPGPGYPMRVETAQREVRQREVRGRRSGSGQGGEGAVRAGPCVGHGEAMGAGEGA